MSHAEKCPVCYGSGKLTEQPSVSTGDNMKTCHGCNGRGWITVGDDIPEFSIGTEISEVYVPSGYSIISAWPYTWFGCSGIKYATNPYPDYKVQITTGGVNWNGDFYCDAGELMDVNEVVNIYLDDDDQTKGTVDYPKKKAYIKKIGHVQLD